MNDIVDRLAQTGPQRIRILCPSRDFIADAWLAADGHGGIGMQLHGPHKPYVFNQLASWYGYYMSLAERRAWRQPAEDVSVPLRCTNRRCTYSGKFRYPLLAAALAEAALAGRTEFRLTH